MEISEQLTRLFDDKSEDQGHSYVVEVPKQEVDIGYVDPTEDYQVAVLKQPSENSQPATTQNRDDPSQQPDIDQPPVSTGETRVVEITEMGDQGRRAHTCRAWIRGDSSGDGGGRASADSNRNRS